MPARPARQGKARQGKARQGKARQGKVTGAARKARPSVLLGVASAPFAVGDSLRGIASSFHTSRCFGNRQPRRATHLGRYLVIETLHGVGLKTATPDGLWRHFWS
jgi:hypothetical protein